jgi:hypothetical protein
MDLFRLFCGITVLAGTGMILISFQLAHINQVQLTHNSRKLCHSAML